MHRQGGSALLSIRPLLRANGNAGKAHSLPPRLAHSPFRPDHTIPHVQNRVAQPFLPNQRCFRLGKADSRAISGSHTVRLWFALRLQNCQILAGAHSPHW